MSDLYEILESRATRIDPAAGALEKVFRRARRRRVRRRVASGAGVAILAAATLAGILDVQRAPAPRQAVLAQITGTSQTLEIRKDLGITGPTKSAGDVVAIQSRSASGAAQVTLVHVGTGKQTRVSLPPARSASVSPGGDVVVAITDSNRVVAVDPSAGTKQDVGTGPGTGAASGPSVSWGRTGRELFVFVDDRWVRVTNPGQAGAQAVRSLVVPHIPGGPSLLSISPTGHTAVLFGLQLLSDGAVVPHLYLGSFDGTTVTNTRPVDIPPTATKGPMGWVGDNAFLLGPGPGQALIVRTDGSSVQIRARGIPNPCRLAGTPDMCLAVGPDVFGTNGDGSLLFWQVGASSTSNATGAARLVFYYRTWLDGTHAVRLTGAVGRYGPPVAAR